MLAQNYTYTVKQDERGVTTTLSHKTNGKSKQFFQAVHTTVGIVAHMESLTDENCDGFFPAERKKKVK